MSTSNFNLLPWRERQRSQTLQRWRWGLVLSLLCSVLAAQWMDQYVSQHMSQHAERRLAWQAQMQRLQTAMADAPVWTQRQQEALRVKAQWTHWQDIQQQAWRVMRQVLALPPRGVQIDHVVWREQHLQLEGWAISAAPVQLWQDQLQAQRTDWQAAVWREVAGWGVRQHRFGLSWRNGGGS